MKPIQTLAVAALSLATSLYAGTALADNDSYRDPHRDRVLSYSMESYLPGNNTIHLSEMFDLDRYSRNWYLSRVWVKGSSECRDERRRSNVVVKEDRRQAGRREYLSSYRAWSRVDLYRPLRLGGWGRSNIDLDVNCDSYIQEVRVELERYRR